MATTGRDPGDAHAGDVAAGLRDAGLVRLVGAPDGDSLAATGILARSLSATGTPFQASVVGPFGGTARQTDADLTVAVGRDDASADVAIAGGDVAASPTAFTVAGELDASPDPVLALAGTIAAGAVDATVADAAERAGVEHRPGVAIPTDELAAGLAHSTLFHASFSGDVDAVRAALADLDIDEGATLSDLDEDDRRRVASLVALETTGSDDTTGNDVGSEHAAEAIERTLRPYEGGPLATVGGFADVLDATARERPDVGMSLVLGGERATDHALDAWRTHGARAHEGIRACDVARYDGLVVARGPSMPVGTVARLLADFRSPEPVVLVVSDDEAAAHARGDADGATDVADALDTAANAADGDAVDRTSSARARFDGNADDLVSAFREAL